MTLEVLRIKQGDTFTATFTDSLGDLTGIEIEADILVGKNARRSLTFTEIDLSLGQYQLSATAEETAKWPAGALLCDLKYTGSGVTSRSQSFPIYVSERITL